MSDSKRVLITGANKGIGLATAAAVLDADPEVHVLLGSRDPVRGAIARETVLDDHPEWAERIEVIAIDVSSGPSVERAAESVALKFGRDPAPLYGIVNNAGVGGDGGMRVTLEVNTYGPWRVCREFLPLVRDGGRIVNVSSAAGPMFVAGCSAERQKLLTSPDVTWEQVERLISECLEIAAAAGDFGAVGLGDGRPYGLSKACLNAATIVLARDNPRLTINACTPGFIETDMTRAMTASRGTTPADAGAKPTSEGTKASVFLLLGERAGSGWYFGSDAERSPLDRYRSPGDPPYTGD